MRERWQSVGPKPALALPVPTHRVTALGAGAAEDCRRRDAVPARALAHALHRHNSNGEPLSVLCIQRWNMSSPPHPTPPHQPPCRDASSA